MEHPDHIDGWWFSAARVLPHGDGRRIEIGHTHHVHGTITPCENGLHLSVNALDALQYAPGDIIWRVRGHGTVVVKRDKAACSDRTYLRGGIDVSDVLRHFARLCALDVISLWDAPYTVRQYLRTGDPRIRDAAWAAAGAAAGAAAWDAARDAAGDAAWAAAWAAAGASNEIQGASVLKEQGKPFFFLPMFGINDPSELDAPA
ncbi:MAG TPA: hypothetical protein VMW24_27975 [Sedimentisphaerales bacterium]|nr:hypothetical protein [Sedimentisphaerales bacterium]